MRWRRRREAEPEGVQAVSGALLKLAFWQAVLRPLLHLIWALRWRRADAMPLRCMLLVSAVLATACSTAQYPVNQRMSSIDTASGYRAARIAATQEGDEFFFHMSISGGGARAAALGLGVMEALRDTRITWQGREESLLDELDMLTAVSGGSMLAGWYAMHGQPGLATFEQFFFANPLQDGLLSFALSPRNLWRIQSPRFGRGDLFSEYLDEKLFKGATFGDLSRDPHKPFVTMYASDMVTGARFEFVQDQFDLLCSDLDTVKIARAVAASSAAPIVFSPLTFWNYASLTGRLDCAGRPLPAKSELHLHGGLLQASDKDGRVRPFIHLIDG